MSDTDQVIRYTAKETAALMRKALRAAFPGVKISVRMATGTAHGFMHVTYTDGPTATQVDKVLAPFQSTTFDPMQDLEEYLPPKPVMVDGEPRMVNYTCRGATPQRRQSPEAMAWAHEVMAARPNAWERSNDHIDSEGRNHNAAWRIISQVDLSDGFPDPVETAPTLSLHPW